MAGEQRGFTFFWQSESPFSQWHPSEFTVEGKRFVCAEQYMMHGKAVLFGDLEVAERIWGVGLSAEDPRIQDPAQWRGQNLLGKVLTRLRDELLARGG